LTRWINSHNQHNMNLNFLVIQEKAVSLFKDLKLKAEEGGRVNVEDLELKANHGWFERFKTQDQHTSDRPHQAKGQVLV